MKSLLDFTMADLNPKILKAANKVIRWFLILVFPVNLFVLYGYQAHVMTDDWHEVYLYKSWLDLALLSPLMLAIVVMLVFRDYQQHQTKKIAVVVIAGVFTFNLLPMLGGMQDFIPYYGALIPFTVFPAALVLLLSERYLSVSATGDPPEILD